MGDWVEPRMEQVWQHEQFRAVDTSASAVVLQLLRALAGLAAAYVFARILTERWLELGSDKPDIALETAIHVTFSGVALFITSARPIRRDLAAQRDMLRAGEVEMISRVAQQAFLRDVQDALDMGESEGDALEVTAKALRDAAPGPAELLVADASRAHLRRAAHAPDREPPCCSVETPWGCPAVRQGRTLRFERSDDLSACPRLTSRGGEVLTAVCVPITILGTPTAVIHATAPVEDDAFTAQTIDRLEGVAAQVGTRLGVLRAMARSQLQAETDPLTGLLNRRAMEERVRHLREAGRPFALAMADLDHFKHLNDSYGHDTGDRALRTFARVLREAVRDADVVSRHGGEEFVVVLPGVDALTAAPVLHRIRDKLEEAVGTAMIPTFTVSMGVADSTWSSDLADVLRAADHALMAAKAQGRDRLVIADPPASGSTVPAEPLPQIEPDAIDPDVIDPVG
jgi:diguanylate cyclase (GGDEF)-like protein